jgi:hypothetical protein
LKQLKRFSLSLFFITKSPSSDEIANQKCLHYRDECKLETHQMIYTAETYIRHPNSYLPKYNIQSETDGESIPLTQSNDAMANSHGGMNGNRMGMGQQRILLKNGIDIGTHQIIQSDEDDVPAYGFPSQKRRNRMEQSDLELNKGGTHYDVV